jgi:hypothetical protein
MTLQYLQAEFSLPLRFEEIARWRGAWCELAGWDVDYFHNHNAADGSVIYRYPLLQYRAWRRRAGFVAFQEAVPAIQEALIAMDWELRWEDTPTPLSLRQMHMRTHELHLDSKWHYYKLHNYLPFNSKNFASWQELTLLTEKVQFLNKLIPNHILGFASGINWRLEGYFDVELTNFIRQRPMTLHDIVFPAFTLEFRTQLFLPSGLGLGKGVSHGFGTLEYKGASPFAAADQEE